MVKNITVFTKLMLILYKYNHITQEKMLFYKIKSKDKTAEFAFLRVLIILPNYSLRLLYIYHKKN